MIVARYPLLEKESVGGAKPLVGLLDACFVAVFHWHSSHDRNGEYVT